MKRNWLFFTLICSVGLNLGIIASFACWRYGSQPGLPASPLPFREMTHSLSLRPEQSQVIRSLLPEHQKRIADLRLGLAQRRQELLEILKAGEPSGSAAYDKIREISGLQEKLEKEMVRFFLGLRNSLKPEQKIIFMKFMEHHLLAGHDSKGRGHGPRGPRGRSGPKARGTE